MEKEPVNIIVDKMVLGAGISVARDVALGYALDEKCKKEESEDN